MTRFKHIIGDGALWIALVLLFGLAATVRIVAQDVPTCSYIYSSWEECGSNGKQVRTVQSATPDGCSGEPEVERSCTYTAPTCSYTYSSWGTCSANGKQTRTVQSQSPTGCEGNPETERSCTYTAPTCSYTYSSWGTCQSNGTQTRTVLSAYPTGCSGGNPQTSQSCTYSGGGGSTTCAFTYNSWSDCQSNGMRTRTVASATPTGCTGGTPVLSETCTYSGDTTSGATACAYTYSSWGACQSDGKQTRTVLTATPSGCSGTPAVSQGCTSTASTTSTTNTASTTPTTTTSTCAFTYSSWGDCKSNGSQTRSVASATPTGCVGNPETSRSCTYTSSDGTTTTVSSCAYTYSAWGNCSTSGIQTRTVLSYSPSGCVGSPSISQSCTPSSANSTLPVCAYTYSAWGLCQSNSLQTRAVLSQAPLSCSGNPEVMRTCSYISTTTTSGGSTSASSTTSALPVCAYTYSPWGMCQSNGTQTRSAISRTPSNCVGDPYVSQFCTYSFSTTGNMTTAPACAFSYTPWSGCLSTGLETRSVVSRTPSSCVGTPEISRSCTSSAGVSASLCSYTYSPWISCQPSGMEMRSVVSQTPPVCAGTPELSRSCTYTPTASTSASSSGASATASNFTFSDLPPDMTFSGMSRVKGVISGATGVEYFLVNPASNAVSSIGTAEQTRENLWERSFDSTVFPNGSFLVMARVKTANGASESARVKVIVMNRSTALSTVSTPSSGDVSSESKSETGASSDTAQTVASEEKAKEIASAVVALKDFRGATTGKWQKLYFGSDRCEREDFCGADADPDNDDLVNKDEFRYNTNPLAADTDGDDFFDGKEVRDGFNPLLAARGDKNDQITYESPKEAGTVEKELFAVGNVEAISSETNIEEKVLKLTGTGPANTLINVFVYSELPTILTVKTDADGNWSYTLEKNLDDGEHQVYVAVTDNAGKITAKSEPLAFVKTAQAATVIPPAEAAEQEASVSPAEKRKTFDMLLLAGLVIVALLSALALIGFLLRRKKMQTESESAESGSLPSDEKNNHDAGIS